MGQGACRAKDTVGDYIMCAATAESPIDTPMWVNMQNDREVINAAAASVYWRSAESPMSSGRAYKPKLTVKCIAPTSTPSTSEMPNPIRGLNKPSANVMEVGTWATLVDVLDITQYATSEMGKGVLEYYVPHSTPADWTVVLDDTDRSDKNTPFNDLTFKALLKLPYTWSNFNRCMPGVWDPGNPSQQVWNNDKDAWCPQIMKVRQCMFTTDFYSTREDAACLDSLKSNWGRWGDTQCSKKGRTLNSVLVPLPDSYEEQVPPFCARRVVYQKWAPFYLPVAALVAVENGKYAMAVGTYEQHDSSVFKGIRRAVNDIGTSYSCPSGTWLTCAKAPVAGKTVDNSVCSYPVAFTGSTAEEWRKDVITFYAESGSVTNEITQQLSFSNQKGRNAYEKMVPGLNDTSCFPCATAGGKTHYGVTVPAPSPVQVNNHVLPFHCPGSFEPPQECPIGKVVPYNRVTGLSTSAVCVCDHGYRPDGDGCVMCPAGTFCNVTDAYDATSGAVKTPDPRPIPCPSGYWAGAGSSDCTKCSTDASACTVRQQMSACTPVEGTSDISVRTQYQKEAPRCVSCLDCKGVGKEDGRPCVGTKQKQS